MLSILNATKYNSSYLLHLSSFLTVPSVGLRPLNTGSLVLQAYGYVAIQRREGRSLVRGVVKVWGCSKKLMVGLLFNGGRGRSLVRGVVKVWGCGKKLFYSYSCLVRILVDLPVVATTYVT